jgi:hypothetical protein
VAKVTPSAANAEPVDRPDPVPRLTASAIALAVITAALFSRALLDGHGFVGFDDMDNLVRNTGYHGLGWTQIRWAFFAAHLGVYEPVSWLFRGLQYEVFGVSAFGSHLVTLGVHVINTLLVWSLARRVFRWVASDTPPARVELGALVAGALFALHPLRVEVVSWASGQPYALATCFGLLSIHAYLGYAADPKRLRLLVGAGALYVLAVLSKSALIALPMVMLCIDVLASLANSGVNSTASPAADSPGTARRSVARCIGEKLPIFAASIALARLAMVATRDAQHGTTLELSARLARVAASPGFYVSKTLWPAELTAHYPIPPAGLGLWQPATLFSAALVIGLSLWLSASRTRWGAAVAWFAFLFILAPVAGLMQHGAPTIGADRYAYASMIPLAVLAGAAMMRLPVIRRGHAAAAAVIASLLCSTTWRQVGVWADSEQLWSYALAIDPTNGMAGNNLGFVLLESERFEEAADVLSAAYPFAKDNTRLVLNLGLAFDRLQRYQAAFDLYEEALPLHDHSAGVHNNLAVIYGRWGDVDRARAHFQRAVELDPSLEPARRGLESLQSE